MNPRKITRMVARGQDVAHCPPRLLRQAVAAGLVAFLVWMQARRDER